MRAPPKKGQSDADAVKAEELRDDTPTQRDPHDPDVAYMPPELGPFVCDHCEYFVDGEDRCTKVAGFIDGHGCCNLYEKCEEHFEGSNA